MTVTSNFEPAPCDIRCRDVWPKDKIRVTALQAYKQLHDAKQIMIRFPVVFFRDCLVIVYLSSIPIEWIRDSLKKAEDAMTPQEQMQLEV